MPGMSQTSDDSILPQAAVTSQAAVTDMICFEQVEGREAT